MINYKNMLLAVSLCMATSPVFVSAMEANKEKYVNNRFELKDIGKISGLNEEIEDIDSEILLARLLEMDREEAKKEAESKLVFKTNVHYSVGTFLVRIKKPYVDEMAKKEAQDKRKKNKFLERMKKDHSSEHPTILEEN